MVRTSVTDPLQIAEICTFPNFGRIGITFCPGKKDKFSLRGSWDRDLATDLDVIKAWGAATIVTLIEAHEFELLKVEALGDEIRARHMDWAHLPILDVSVPDTRFEAAWLKVGEALRAQLCDGANVIVHCRGGLGRAGTIAARLLVELGTMGPEEAIARVRAVRPGAIETLAQENHVRNCGPVPRTS